MKKLLVIMTFLVSSFSLAGDVRVLVGLSPAGSFEAQAKIHNGVVKTSKGKFFARNMYVYAKDLKTGIGLRDDHLYKRLDLKKHPKIKVLKAVGKSGKGVAIVEIRGVKKKVPFKFSKKSGGKVAFDMDIVLKDFKFDKKKDGLSYMGIGVKDKISISGMLKSMKYVAKKKKKRNSRALASE